MWQHIESGSTLPLCKFMAGPAGLADLVDPAGLADLADPAGLADLAGPGIIKAERLEYRRHSGKTMISSQRASKVFLDKEALKLAWEGG